MAKMKSKVTYKHRGRSGKWIPEFYIGKQGFALQEVRTKEEVKFFHRMLKIAFKKLL